MQAKISASTDCLRFPRLTGGNLPAPADNSYEVFIVCIRADFFKPRDVFFYLVPNTLTKVTICCLWSQWWTLEIWFCSKKVGLFFAGSSNRYPKKQLAEKVFTTIKMIGNWLLSLFLVFSLIPRERKITSKSRSWSWIAFETQCILRCIHVIDLVLKYGSDINEGNWLQLLFYFIVLMGIVASVIGMSFFIFVSGFRLKFSRIGLWWKRLQLDSKSDLTTKGLILGFFVGEWLLSLTSYLHALKTARIVQMFFFFFDDIKSFR